MVLPCRHSNSMTCRAASEHYVSLICSSVGMEHALTCSSAGMQHAMTYSSVGKELAMKCISVNMMQ